MDTLERYLLEESMLRRRLQGRSVKKDVSLAIASGRLPHGPVGHCDYDGFSAGVERFAEDLSRLIGENALEMGTYVGLEDAIRDYGAGLAGKVENAIHPGQELTVPRYGSQVAATGVRDYAVKGDGTYVVRRGDTLWDIARGLGISVDSLRAANSLSANAVIKPGQSLRLSGRGGSAPAAAGTARAASRWPGTRPSGCSWSALAPT